MKNPYKSIFLFYVLCVSLLILSFAAWQAGRWYIKKSKDLHPGHLHRQGQHWQLETGLGNYKARLPGKLVCIPARPATKKAPLSRANKEAEKRLNNLQGLCKNSFSPSLLHFLIFQEDQAFFRHQGFSTRELRISLWRHIWHGERLRGASTITQQLARSLFGLRGRSFQRKLIEFRIARYLETHFSKQEILTLYLNTVYFGHNRRGIKAAARFYFGKAPGQLSHTEEAFLIALLPSPEACRSPKTCKNKRVLARLRRILQQANALH